MFWLHCNHCGVKPVRNQPLRFVLTDCRHVLCTKCGWNRQSCPQCSHRPLRAIVINQNMPEKYQKLFKSPMVEIHKWEKIIAKANDFQRKQFGSLACNLRNTQSTLFNLQRQFDDLKNQHIEVRNEIKQTEATKEQNNNLREQVRQLENMLTKKMNNIPTEDVHISESFLQLPPKALARTEPRAKKTPNDRSAYFTDPNNQSAATENQSFSIMLNDQQGNNNGRASGRQTDSVCYSRGKQTPKQMNRTMPLPEKSGSERQKANDGSRDAFDGRNDHQLLNFTREDSVNHFVNVVEPPNMMRTPKSGGFTIFRDQMLNKEKPIVMATFNTTKRSNVEVKSLGGSVKGKINQRITQAPV